MQEHYHTAQTISMLTASALKDAYRQDWKLSVHAALDALKTEIKVSTDPLGLTPRLFYDLVDIGATFYLEATLPGRKWTVPRSSVSRGPFVAPVIPPSQFLPWDPATQKSIHPEIALRFQRAWVHGNAVLTEFNSTLPACTICQAKYDDCC